MAHNRKIDQAKAGDPTLIYLAQSPGLFLTLFGGKQSFVRGVIRKKLNSITREANAENSLVILCYLSTVNNIRTRLISRSGRYIFFNISKGTACLLRAF